GDVHRRAVLADRDRGGVGGGLVVGVAGERRFDGVGAGVGRGGGERGAGRGRAGVVGERRGRAEGAVGGDAAGGRGRRVGGRVVALPGSGDVHRRAVLADRDRGGVGGGLVVGVAGERRFDGVGAGVGRGGGERGAGRGRAGVVGERRGRAEGAVGGDAAGGRGRRVGGRVVGRVGPGDVHRRAVLADRDRLRNGPSSQIIRGRGHRRRDHAEVAANGGAGDRHRPARADRAANAARAGRERPGAVAVRRYVAG